jgi:hypothetical protein
MARYPFSTDAISTHQVALFFAAFAYAMAIGAVPNVFITVRWDQTKMASDPFQGLQRLIERLRKMHSHLSRLVYFWVRERENTDGANEHAHIAIFLPSVDERELRALVCSRSGCQKVW